MPDSDEFVFKSASSPVSEKEIKKEAKVETPADSILSPKTDQIKILLDPLLGPAINQFHAKLQETITSLAQAQKQANTFQSPALEPTIEPTEPLESPIEESPFVNNSVEREKELLEAMRAESTQFWATQRATWQSSKVNHLAEQEARLQAANALQQRLLAAGPSFDLKLFEEAVGALSRGRDSVYGRERMARFWEILADPTTSASVSQTDDVLLNLLQ